MKYLPQIFVLIITSSLLACNSSASDESNNIDSVNTNTLPVSPVNPSVPPGGITTPVIPTTPSPGGLNPEHGQPGHRCDIGVGEPLTNKPSEKPIDHPMPTVTTSPVVTTTNPAPQVNTISKPTAGLNPAHGQPGHRCDISVGDPLNSKPIPPAATISQPQKSLPNTPLLPAPAVKTETVTPAGMNPEHGKPGHRCDISVGAPLNSKPAQ